MRGPRTAIALLLCLAGCTVKLKIGELLNSNDGSGCRPVGQGCSVASDCCSQVCGPLGCELPDAGESPDSGTPDSGTPDGGASDAGGQVLGAACLRYTDCLSHECQSGRCADRSDLMCGFDAGFCDSDAGFCFTTDVPCMAFTDCCNADCSKGFCRFGDPSQWLPPVGDADGGGCLAYGTCTNYFDCCSGNCFLGACASPSDPRLCITHGPCLYYRECCSFDCFDGQCRDPTQ